MQAKQRARLRQTKIEPTINSLPLAHFTEQLAGVSKKPPQKHDKN
jgi:hypothetical protein